MEPPLVRCTWRARRDDPVGADCGGLITPVPADGSAAVQERRRAFHRERTTSLSVKGAGGRCTCSRRLRGNAVDDAAIRLVPQGTPPAPWTCACDHPLFDGLARWAVGQHRPDGAEGQGRNPDRSSAAAIQVSGSEIPANQSRLCHLETETQGLIPLSLWIRRRRTCRSGDLPSAVACDLQYR